MGNNSEKVIDLFNRFWEGGINKFGNPSNLEKLLEGIQTDIRSTWRLELIQEMDRAIDDEDYMLAAEIKRKLDGISR